MKHSDLNRKNCQKISTINKLFNEQINTQKEGRHPYRDIRLCIWAFISSVIFIFIGLYKAGLTRDLPILNII